MLCYSTKSVLAAAIFVLAVTAVHAQTDRSAAAQRPADLQAPLGRATDDLEQSLPPDIYVTEHIGILLHLGAVVSDEDGKLRPLGTFFKNELPKVLLPVYYGCPSLCTVTLNRFIAAIEELPYTVGKDYEVLAFSIDPREKAALALEKKQAYLRETRASSDGRGWHFLTAPGASIRMLMDQVGFKYRYDQASMEYLHRATLIFVDPQGKVVRYLHGSNSSSTSIRLALMEAGQGKLGSLGERVAAHLFEYNSERRRYGPSMLFMVSALALLSLALGSLLWISVRWFRRRTQRTAS